MIAYTTHMALKRVPNSGTQLDDLIGKSSIGIALIVAVL